MLVYPLLIAPSPVLLLLLLLIIIDLSLIKWSTSVIGDLEASIIARIITHLRLYWKILKLLVEGLILIVR